jgi:UDP-N-acetylenolpyruvoylglucosamine reductase
MENLNDIVKEKIKLLFEEEAEQDIRDIISNGTIYDTILGIGKNILVSNCKLNGDLLRKYTRISVTQDQWREILKAMQLKFKVRYNLPSDIYIIEKRES